MRSCNLLNLFAIPLLVFVVACSGGNQRQDIADTQTIKVPEIDASVDSSLHSIADIKRAYERIVTKESAGELDSQAIAYVCDDEIKGTLIYYSDNKGIKLIVHRYSEYDHFSAEERYFLQHEEPFFVLRKETTWAFISGSEGSTRDNVTETRTYLANEKAIQCLESKYNIYTTKKQKRTEYLYRNKSVSCKDISSLTTKYNKLMAYRNVKKGCPL